MLTVISLGHELVLWSLFLIVGSLAQLLYSGEGLDPASSWYARLVDSPKEALHPLRSRWELGWGLGMGAGKGMLGGTGVGM